MDKTLLYYNLADRGFSYNEMCIELALNVIFESFSNIFFKILGCVEAKSKYILN